jgi:hypothetical protein
VELFKENENEEIIKKTLDPEAGIILPEDIKIKNSYKKSLKAHAFRESHKNKNKKSDIEEIEENFKILNNTKQDLVALENLSDDFEEVLVSLDELIDYLDNSEEYIDV